MIIIITLLLVIMVKYFLIVLLFNCYYYYYYHYYHPLLARLAAAPGACGSGAGAQDIRASGASLGRWRNVRVHSSNNQTRKIEDLFHHSEC